MRFALAAVLLLAALPSCTTTRDCKDQTILVTISFDGPAAGADAVVISVSVDNGATHVSPAEPVSSSSGTVEVDFPNGYPAGKKVSVTAEAHKGGTTLATTSSAVTLSSNCGALALSFASGGGDGGGGDGGSDACTPMTTCPSSVTCGKISDGCGGMIDCGACQLWTLEPQIASSGDTVYLEGLFSAPATVTFPGGATASATVLSAHRATVLVPPAAGAGVLTVTANGSTTQAMPFQRASYTIGMQTIRSDYEQIDYARQTPTLQDSIFWGAAAARSDTRAWVIGGSDGGSGKDSVQQAMINADGSLGAFVSTANKLSTARALHTVQRIGSWVYAIGGRDKTSGASALASVERAPINADGTLGAWADAGVALTTPRFSHASAVVGGWLYVFGGTTGASCTPQDVATIERAPIKPDGSLGAFQDSGLMFANTRSGLSIAVSASNVYAIGGLPGTATDQTIVETSPIGTDGALLGFSSAGGKLPGGRSAGIAWAIGGKVWYLAGGGSSTILSANINGDGSLANFADTGVQGSAENSSSLLVGNYVYVFNSGFYACCSACALAKGAPVARGSLQAAGTLGPFGAVNASNLSTTRSGFGLAVLGNNVYAIGSGGNGAAQVEHATVKPDGSLGTFAADPGITFVANRNGPTVAIAGKYLYAIGGIDPATNTAINTVEVAPIGSDGTFGPFALATVGGNNLVVVAQPAGGAVVEGNQLCTWYSDATTSAIQCAQLNADGTVAAQFAADPNGHSSPQRPGPLPLVISVGMPGTLYELAGGVGGGSVLSAPLGGSALVSSAPTVDATAGTVQGVGYSGVVSGNVVWLLGGFGGLGEVSTIQKSALDPKTAAPGSFAAASGSLMFGTSGHRSVILGNHVYTIGGSSNGSPAPTEAAELH